MSLGEGNGVITLGLSAFPAGFIIILLINKKITKKANTLIPSMILISTFKIRIEFWFLFLSLSLGFVFPKELSPPSFGSVEDDVLLRAFLRLLPGVIFYFFFVFCFFLFFFPLTCIEVSSVQS